MIDTDNGKSTTWLKFFGCFLLCLQRTVLAKLRILFGNPDTSIKRSHKKKNVFFFKKSNTIDALIQKIQLDEHGKFRYYVMLATMDMLIYNI
jgi:hypothetical protein